jgi:hypothetical protein
MQHLRKTQTNKLSTAARDQAGPVAACKLERVDAPAATPCRRTRRKSPSKGRSPSRGRCRRGSRTANCRCSSSTQAPPFTSNDSLCELSPEPQSNVKKPSTETSRRSSSTTAPPCTSKYPNQKTCPTYSVTKNRRAVSSHNLSQRVVDAPAAPLRRRSCRVAPSESCRPGRGPARQSPQPETSRRSSSTTAPPYTSKDSVQRL